MIRHFYHQSDAEAWSVLIENNQLSVFHGSKYGEPAVTKRSFDNLTECTNKADDLIAEKLQQGYEKVPLHIPGVPVVTLYEVYKVQQQQSDSLELYQTNGSEALIELICTFTFLKKLRINQVTIIPDTIRNLKELKELTVDMSPSLTEIPGSIGELRNLYVLSIGNTAIRELPDSIGDLANLGVLQVHNNQLLYGLPSTIGKLKKLHMLTAFLNRDSEDAPAFFVPESLGDLSNLDRLNLAKNNLVHLPDTLGKLQELTLIELGDNHFTEIPALIFQLPNLYLIGMENCRITSVPRELCNLNELEYVNLENNKIADVPNELVEEGWCAIRTFLESDNNVKSQPGSGKKTNPMEMLVKEFQAAHGAVLPPLLKQFILDGDMQSRPSFTFMDGDQQERTGIFATDIGRRMGGMADQLIRITVGNLAKKTEPIGFADVKPLRVPDEYDYQLIVFPKYGWPDPNDQDPYPVYLVKFKGYPNEEEDEEEEEMQSDFDCSIHKVADSLQEFLLNIK